MRITVVSGGPDLNGFFLSAEDPDRFEEVPRQLRGDGPPAVPLPPALVSLVIGVAALLGMRGASARRRLG